MRQAQMETGEAIAHQFAGTVAKVVTASLSVMNPGNRKTRFGRLERKRVAGFGIVMKPTIDITVKRAETTIQIIYLLTARMLRSVDVQKLMIVILVDAVKMWTPTIGVQAATAELVVNQSTRLEINRVAGFGIVMKHTTDITVKRAETTIQIIYLLTARILGSLAVGLLAVQKLTTVIIVKSVKIRTPTILVQLVIAALVVIQPTRAPGCKDNHHKHFCKTCKSKDADHRSAHCPGNTVNLPLPKIKTSGRRGNALDIRILKLNQPGRCKVAGCTENHEKHICQTCQDTNSDHHTKDCPVKKPVGRCRARGCAQTHTAHLCPKCNDQDADHLPEACRHP